MFRQFLTPKQLQVSLYLSWMFFLTFTSLAATIFLSAPSSYSGDEAQIHNVYMDFWVMT